MLQEDAEPFSPELVLICPELREIALAREREAAQVVRRVEAAPQRQPAPSTARRSAVPVTTMALAVALAIGAYMAGYVSGASNTPQDAAHSTPSAIVLGAPPPGPRATSETPSLALSNEPSPAATITVGPAPAAPGAPAAPAAPGAPAAPAAPAPLARSSGNDSRVVLSADGLYVTSLGGPACPGVPKLPWLLVSSGRFAWEGELDGFLVRVAGRLAAGDRVSGTAAYRGPGCDRTITYRGRATRAAR